MPNCSGDSVTKVNGPPVGKALKFYQIHCVEASGQYYEQQDGSKCLPTFGLLSSYLMTGALHINSCHL